MRRKATDLHPVVQFAELNKKSKSAGVVKLRRGERPRLGHNRYREATISHQKRRGPLRIDLVGFLPVQWTLAQAHAGDLRYRGKLGVRLGSVAIQ